VALISEELSVWTLAFRWCGLDPERLWIRLPLQIKDNVRNLIDAILKGELVCETITLEKRDFTPDEKEFSVYYWLDDIYACINGHRYNRKLLRYAIIDRYDFKLWCERRGIPLPEFWFPPGWKMEYELPEGELHPGYWYLRKDWTAEDWASWKKDQEAAQAKGQPQAPEVTPDAAAAIPAQSEANPADPLPSDSPSKQEEAIEKLRANQEARIACCQIAKAIWKDDPTRTIASVVKDELIQKYGGGSYYVDETVREWVRRVAPPGVREKRGRPRKNGVEGE
jgi:hypothetical protein